MTNRCGNCGAKVLRFVASLLLALLAMIASDITGYAQDVPPDREWKKSDPAKLGWSMPELAQAETLMRELRSMSVMVVQKNHQIVAWGDVTRRVRVASVRKSLLSALYGIAVADGRIDLDWTLGKLAIGDTAPRLTDLEKTAKIRDLLQARSGVYHLPAVETEQQSERRPQRGSHPPGAFWYYNNWDFNALGTIYRRLTGEDIFGAFERHIAKPIGMQDFSAADGRYVRRAASVHPAYHMHLSARDLARFGVLYLKKGRWGERQVVPETWVSESTHAHSSINRQLGYGYMWWVSRGDLHLRTRFGKGAYSARGYGGQLLVVAPAYDLVIVHLTEVSLSDSQTAELLARILAAAPQQ